MRNLQNRYDQSLLGFIIALPVLLVLMMAIMQFGMLLDSYLILKNAAIEAARVGTTGSSNAEIQGTIISTSPNLEPEKLNIHITPSEGSRKSGEPLIVKLRYNYDLKVPIIGALFGKTIVLNVQTSMKIK